MKVYQTDFIRNVALVGHQGSGKTSLVEALLYNSGATNRIGRVEDGSTVSDWDDEEKARGLSLSTSLVPIEFMDHKVNILDTPGFTDFQGEMKNAIRVADAVIVVVDAVAGVEVGTELAWEYARKYQQPIIVVINKMDRENTDFDATLQQLKDTFPKYKFIPVMQPIGSESAFKGVVNLLTMKAYYDAGGERAEMPEELQDRAEAMRLELVEAAAEADDDYLQKYFDEETLDDEEIRQGMRKASRSHLLHTVPVFVTSATSNIGTIPLMEALIAYTSPPTVRRVQVRHPDESKSYITAPNTDDKDLAAYVFKTTNDRYVGTLSFFRIFAGSMKADARYYNVTREEEERFGNLIVLRGKEQFTVPELHCGDIGVVSKLNVTQTGDTFAPKGSTHQILKPEFPNPLYLVSVTPRTQADSAKMGATLTNLAQADPTLRWRQDSDTKEVILEGMGDIHVQVTIKHAEALGVGIDTHLPKVPYRETILNQAEATYRHKKQTGGAGQFGEVTLRVIPIEEEEFQYTTNIFGGAISQQFLPSIEKGIRSVLEEGIIAGFPVVKVKAEVFDGKEHPVDSKDIAFQIAGREAFREAFRAAKPVLMEPIYDVRVTVPEPMMGDIMSDLNGRRGRVQGMDSSGNKSIINAQVPLAEMLRYGNDLRSMTGGRGLYTMSFSHYEQVPSHLQDDIIAAHAKQAAEA